MGDTDQHSTDESPSENTYECSACGYRMQSAHQPEDCPKCGSQMIDISVPRE